MLVASPPKMWNVRPEFSFSKRVHSLTLGLCSSRGGVGVAAGTLGLSVTGIGDVATVGSLHLEGKRVEFHYTLKGFLGGGTSQLQEIIPSLSRCEVWHVVQTANQFVSSLETASNHVGYSKGPRPVPVHGPHAVPVDLTKAQSAVACPAGASF